MDFVKTLLVYMSLTLATGLQAAPTPEVTPVPTAAPTAIVTAAPQAQRTATPEPRPTITPNRSYATLRYGDKGNNVKKLQQRLIELGYLKGSADGAYGAQTQSAVSAFQKANGLGRDGVAGPATLTTLYEDPNVVPNPATVTATPEPTATPDANGMIPLPDDPMSTWINRYGATVLLNGSAVQLSDGRRPRLWQRGSAYLLSVNDMAAMASDWAFSAESAAAASLTIAGHSLAIRMRENIAATRAADDTSYCEMYNLWVDSLPVAVDQGDIASERGQWYLSTAALEKAIQAEVRYDSDENALILRYTAAGSLGGND